MVGAIGGPALASGLLRRRRIGLLGGSFNPVHGGHLHITHEALRRLGLDEVWWLVAPQNPLKSSADMAPLGDRLQRARAAVDDRRIRVSDLENRLGTRYTVDTLIALGRRCPTTRFVWLMGADNLAELPAWQRWTMIFHRTVIAVFAREPYDFGALGGIAAHRFKAMRLPAKRARLLATARPPGWVYLPIRRHPASATQLRAAGRFPENRVVVRDVV